MLVVNQDTDVRAAIASAGDGANIVLVTTHALFDFEKRELAEAASGELTVLSFADLLDDATLLTCDQRSSDRLRDHASVGQAAYSGFFERVSCALKNEAIFRYLSAAYPGAVFRYGNGLGIDATSWRPHSDETLPATPREAHAPAATNDDQVHAVTVGAHTYVFATAISRLVLRGTATVASRPLSGGLAHVLRQPDPWATLRRHLVGAIPPHTELHLATTIHGYDPRLLAFQRPLRVLVDGYHPPNYPRTYLDSYDSSVQFECRDPFSRQWFETHGRACQFGSHILEPAHMSEPTVRWRGRRPVIVVALNHAGDWSALINRSDTDRLVLATLDVARALPAVDVILRPHPTMVHPQHEGICSRERIERSVERAGLKNLVVSSASLNEDFARGDIFISEYSQVLIDAISMGRLGVAANLTGRRSFLQAYEDLGLPSARCVHDLLALLRSIVSATPESISRQRDLVRRFNALSEATARGCSSCGGHALAWQQPSTDAATTAERISCKTCEHAFSVRDLDPSNEAKDPVMTTQSAPQTTADSSTLLSRLRALTEGLKPAAVAELVDVPPPVAVPATRAYQVVDPTHAAQDAWHHRDVAIAQERAFRPLLDQLRAGSVRQDFASVAQAIAATGIARPTLLEVGCGSGYYREVLEALVDGGVAHTGVDYSSEMIALAKTRYPQGDFHVGDATALPFDDRSFDIVMDGVALMHIPDYEKAIQQARRVARRFVIFNTAVLLKSRPTTTLAKEAYGRKTSEVIINEGELRSLLAKYGMYVAASFDSIPYDLSATLGEATYTKTLVCGLIGDDHAAGPVLLNLGCAGHFHPVWMNVDIASPHPAVMDHNLLDGIPLPDATCDAVYHSHMLEHLPKWQVPGFLAECHRVTRPGGVIRVAVPDLEQICRHYLANLEGAAGGDGESEARYDWMMLELVDQMTRQESGGEMVRFWRQNPMPAEEFVVERVGQEVKGYLAQVRAQGSVEAPRQSPTALATGQFRLGGEVHQWMYDRFSLKRLLLQAGFAGPRICRATDSRIAGFEQFWLDSDEQGRTRKPDSLFMEARRI